MAGIAIIGYGVVGSGVFEALRTNQAILEKKAGQPLHIRKVLDLRSFPGDPVEPFLTHDARDIFEDETIDIIAEAIGGLTPAYEFHKRALSGGKHIVTSNKELVAKHGPELLDLAKRNQVNFLFEASVGGAIPIIRPLNETLSAEHLSQVAGILNGTTNYILSHMQAHGLSFEEALRQAQERGYAERDPSADVEGLDACRKLAILLSLATGLHVRSEEIYTEGITRVEKEDFLFAGSRGNTIKLLAKGDILPDRVEAMVAPMLVSQSAVFASVNDVYNAVMVTGNITDNTLFYGRGAGKLPAAGAVVGDIVEAARHLHIHVHYEWSPETIPVAPFDDVIHSRQVRLAYTNKKDTIRAAEKVFGIIEWIETPVEVGQTAFIAPPMKECEFREKMERFTQISAGSFQNALRIYADR